MTAILRAFREAEERFDRRAEYFASHHPVMAFWAMFVGIPLFILMTVSASTRGLPAWRHSLFPPSRSR